MGVVALTCSLAVEMSNGWFAITLITCVSISAIFAGKVNERYYSTIAAIAAGSQCGFLMQAVLAKLSGLDHFHALALCIVLCAIGWNLASQKFRFQPQTISVSFVGAFTVVQGAAHLFGKFPTIDQAVLHNSEFKQEPQTSLVFLAYFVLFLALVTSFAFVNQKKVEEAKEVYNHFTKIESNNKPLLSEN